MNAYPNPNVLVLNNSNVAHDNPLPTYSTIYHNGTPVSDNNMFPITFEPTLTDAFGRFRISQPFTLFDSYHRFQDNGKINTYTFGNGTTTYDSNACSILMTVGTNLGDFVYRESAKVFSYQPGKSLLIMQTFCMSSAKYGLRQRQGYFDINNGIYLQLLNNTLSFVKRSKSTGTIIETVVNQSNWNYDRMDGMGLSKINIDITKCQILFIDIEWLGVGSVRCGFVINGKFCICHIFNHANIVSLPYMMTACLPVRAEIENIENTGSLSIYRLICTSIISEGGYELRGRQFSIGYDNISLPKTLITSNLLYPVISIKLKATRLNAIVILTQINIIGTTSSDFRWVLIKNPTIIASWSSVQDDSSVEYTINASNTISDGTILKSGYFTSSNGLSPIINLNDGIFKYQLERNTFTNTGYNITLAVAGKGSNDKVLGSMDFEEIT